MKNRGCLLLFGLPFALVGVVMLWSIGATLADAWSMHDWVPVEAELMDGGYHTHRSDESDTYEAYAEYRYSYAGRSYTGTRVAISGFSDNIGDFHVELGRRLAANRGGTITVYVDPDDPAEAVVDRSVRWGLQGFKGLFVVVFGGVAALVAWLALRKPKPVPRTAAASTAPWLAEPDWQGDPIRSGSRATMWFAWVFTGIWTLCCVPLPFVAYREIVEEGNQAGWFALLFLLILPALYAWAVRCTIEWRRVGAAPLVLDPFPGAIGGHVGGTVELALPFDPSRRFEVSLTNVLSYASGSGKDRKQKEKALWQDDTIAYAEPGGPGTRVHFRFDVPEDGVEPADTQKDDHYHLWRVNLQAELGRVDLDRSYEIPVYPTAARSQHLPEAALAQAAELQASYARERAAERLHFERGAAGPVLRFPIGRHLGPALIGVLVGGAFLAAGWFIISRGDSVVFGSVFALMGALLTLMCLYMGGNSLRVERDGSDLVSTRRLFGVPIRRRRMPRHAVRKLERSSGLKTQSGGRHVIYYRLHAVDDAGNRVAVGEGFRGKRETDAAVEFIAGEFGLDLDADENVLG